MAFMRMWLLPIIAAASLTGCQAPPEVSGPTQSMVQAESQQRFDALWQACLDVLREHRFEIDRRDLRAGMITTLPETSQGFIEFWRHDVDTAYDLAESTLATVRRQAEVRIIPTDTAGHYDVDVIVTKERLQMAERQIDNAAAALQVFSVNLPVRSRSGPGQRSLNLRRALPGPSEHDAWTPEGRDGAMERRLLEHITARFAATPA